MLGKSVAEGFDFHRDHILGTSFDLAISGSDEPSAKSAESAALEEIERLKAIFNLYDSESEISILNRSDSLVVSDELIEVVQTSEKWRQVTRNKFSARIGSILKKWKEARESGSLPHRPSLRVEADEIRRANVFIDPDANTIERPSNILWVTDAIAKGYIIDKAFAAALAACPNAEGILLDIGGDLRVFGNSPQGEAWKVGVAKPSAQADNTAPDVVVALAEGAIATSGHSARSFEIGGKTYSHILDSKSGWPVKASHAATVLAQDATTADALATAFTTMSAVASIELAESLQDVECLIYGYDGRQYASSGWRQSAASSTSMESSDSHWPEDYRLKVEYEVPKLKVSKYRAPYLAIWITDQERKLVKTLTMLGDNPRWTEENYVWWRRYARKEPLLVDAISQPSRTPGRYNLVWDGRDDFGERVPKGDYILNVEASREHGDHTLTQIELSLHDKKLRSRRKSEGELGSIRIEYGLAKR